MKVLLLIDSFGSGGAQRQWVNLGIGLYNAGIQVEFFCYHHRTFFEKELSDLDIRIHMPGLEEGRWSSMRIIFRLVLLIYRGRFDAILSCLTGPNIYGELARLIGLCRVKLVVTELGSYVGEKNLARAKLLRVFHIFACRVVANSQVQAAWLRSLPWLNDEKVQTIYTGSRMAVSDFETRLMRLSSDIRFLILSRIAFGKNGLGLAKGIVCFYRKYGFCPKIDWAGRVDSDAASLKEYKEMRLLIDQYPEVRGNWRFLGERQDVESLLNNADCLIHVSLHEGLPNSICEAFFAYSPVIASNVCEHPVLVGEGVRGILCDPNSPEGICDAIYRFINLPFDRRHEMGLAARRYAEQHLSLEKMVFDYKVLLDDC